MEGQKPEDKHLECISDFCGNPRTPGHWADVFERPDGSRYVQLGGGWEYFTEIVPDVIEDSSEHYEPFIQACADDDDIGYVEKHFPASN